MAIKSTEKKQFDKIPDGYIICISGVPGVGKTSVSYELMQRYKKFRIIEETDLIREILRGYNDYLQSEFGDDIRDIFNKVQIFEHGKILNLEEMKKQCIIMKNSLEQIINRQQRKGIASIINGIHIIPEVLNGLAGNKNIIYFNLYVSDDNILYERLYNRNSLHMLEYFSLISKTNSELYLSTKKLAESNSHIYNIDVTNLTIDETIEFIINRIE